VTVAAVTAVLLGGLAAGLAVIWSDLSPADRDAVRPVLERESGLIGALAFMGVVLLTFGVAWFVGRWSSGARRLAGDLRVAATANPAHQPHAPAGPPELRALAVEAAVLAAAHRGALEERERAAERARADVESERNRLAALMAHITQAVLSCTLEGRILLYNEQARALLGGGTYVGLGRSVFALTPDGELASARDTLVALAERGDPLPEARCAITVGERMVRARLSGVVDATGALSAFLLLAEDVTAAAHSSSRRETLLRELAEGTRASVASVRAAAETLRDYPDLDAEERENFLTVIADEAHALSGRLDAALSDAGEPGAGAGAWTLDPLRAPDALEALARALRSGGRRAVRCAQDAPDAWIALDVHRLGSALRALPEGVGDLELAAAEGGGHVRIDVRWAGAPLDAETLRAWEEREVGGGVRVRDVLAHHAAEAWSQPDANGAFLRVVAPAAAPATPAAPAGRPVTYDFDLFGGLEKAGEFADRPLAELPVTVFDCETTGLEARAGDEIVSIGAVRIVNGRVLAGETFDELVDPRRPVSAASVAIHGLTDAMLAGKPGIETVLPRFARFAEDTVLVGHDVAFDLQFLARHRGHAAALLDQPVLDTLLLAAAASPEHSEHTLDALAARFGMEVTGRHSALGDALMTAEVFLALVRLLAARGVRTLGEATAAARSTHLARVSDSLYAGN
jgi:DNA polymerase-3 subunit epsilon